MLKYENYYEKDEWTVIGVMSGTSVDGLDICAARFKVKKGKYDYEILKASSINYSDEFRKDLINCISFSGEKLVKLDHRFGILIGESINNFLKDESFMPDLIASHGHTVFHQPESGITSQIGDGQTIFQKTGITTINDFRKIDVVKGGQGAPLVPIGDELLFREYDVCLNIGGFANISFSNNLNKRIAYDVGPVNIVLNYLVRDLGKEYDDGGNFARKGNIIKELYNRLNELPYYSQKPPKSLGLEWVKKNIFSRLEKNKYNVNDLLNTYSEHAAFQLNESIKKEVGHRAKVKVLVTGGGAKNTFLIDRMNELGGGVDYFIPEEELVDYKEALIFGLIGLLKYKGSINIYSSVTGAPSDSSGGIIHN